MSQSPNPKPAQKQRAQRRFLRSTSCTVSQDLPPRLGLRHSLRRLDLKGPACGRGTLSRGRLAHLLQRRAPALRRGNEAPALTEPHHPARLLRGSRRTGRSTPINRRRSSHTGTEDYPAPRQDPTSRYVSMRPPGGVVSRCSTRIEAAYLCTMGTEMVFRRPLTTEVTLVVLQATGRMARRTRARGAGAVAIGHPGSGGRQAPQGQERAR